MGDNDLKVTDKRMFTPDGELREEFRHLESEAEAAAERAQEAAATEAVAEPVASEAPPPPPASASEPSPASASESSPDSVSEPQPEPMARPPAAEPEPTPDELSDETPRLEIPGTPEGLGAPTFLDLVTLLAEPIGLYLGDAKLPNGESAENLEMARLHIDLLDVLRRKTAGNLEVGESRLLEDLLYRCRLRYVQKRD